LQEKVNVVVGFVYKKYNREIGTALARDSTFFNDFLGVCGAVTYAGTANAPYSSREMEAIGLDVTPSNPTKKKVKVLPKEFYEALVEAVASPPEHKGTSNCFLYIEEYAHNLNTTLQCLLLAADELIVGDTCGFDSWLGQICLDKGIKYRTFVKSEEQRTAVHSSLEKGSWC
jgi:hypothetical protein